VVPGHPDAVPATSRTAVTPLESNTEWAGDGAVDSRGGTAITAENPCCPGRPRLWRVVAGWFDLVPGLEAKASGTDFAPRHRLDARLPRRHRWRGLIVEHYHPSWTDPLRHVVGTPGQPASPGSTTVTTRPAAGSNEMKQTSHTANSVTYSVPGSPYVLAIKTTPTMLCRGEVTREQDEPLQRDNQRRRDTAGRSCPAGRPPLEAYAGGSSLSVSFQGKPVGTVAVLRYAITYNFNPTRS